MVAARFYRRIELRLTVFFVYPYKLHDGDRFDFEQIFFEKKAADFDGDAGGEFVHVQIKRRVASIPVPKRGHKEVGFSGKVESLTTPHDQKTHERNYSTHALPCILPLADDVTPTTAHGRSDAVHVGTSDDVGTVALDRSWG